MRQWFSFWRIYLKWSKSGVKVGMGSQKNVRNMTDRNTCVEATECVPCGFNSQVMQFRLGRTVSNQKYLEPHHRKPISSRTIYTVFSIAIVRHRGNPRWRLGLAKNGHRFVKGAPTRQNVLYSTYIVPSKNGSQDAGRVIEINCPFTQFEFQI